MKKKFHGHRDLTLNKVEFNEPPVLHNKTKKKILRRPRKSHVPCDLH